MAMVNVENHVRNDITNSPKLKELSAKQLLCFGVTGLNEEAGEVAGLLCREVYKKAEMPQEKWIEELGDVLWYLIAATIAKGLTLEQLWEYNVSKLKERYGENHARG